MKYFFRCQSCWFWTTVISVILLSFILAYQFIEPPMPKKIRIATGREGGGYYMTALQYQKYLTHQQIEVEIYPTAGSIEGARLVQSGQVDVSFAQGGISHTTGTEGLESLAGLFYEPLWIFYQVHQPFKYLFELRGKRVAIGEEGSGTHNLVLQLLKDNDVTNQNTTLLTLAPKMAAQQLLDKQIDVAFFVMSPAAEMIFELMAQPGIELFSFQHHLAYTARYPFLTTLTMGEGVTNLAHNIPHSDKTLLATTANFVVRSDVHPKLIRLLLMAATEIHKHAGIFNKAGQFPSAEFNEFPLNKEANYFLHKGPSFLEKVFPFWLATVLDRLKIMFIPLIAVMLPIFKGILPLYQWGTRYKIFRWYKILLDIDRQVGELHDLESINKAVLQVKILQDELLKIVSVPLSYMHEFYTLREHLRLVSIRLEEKQHEILCQAEKNNESCP